jgi:Cys-rich protein (TIGR01571 family)
MGKNFKNGLFVCGIVDFCIGFFLPLVEVIIASDNAGQSVVMSILQCVFYPCLVPFLRHKVRKQNDIDGNVCQDVALGLACPCCVVIQLKTEFE